MGNGSCKDKNMELSLARQPSPNVVGCGLAHGLPSEAAGLAGLPTFTITDVFNPHGPTIIIFHF